VILVVCANPTLQRTIVLPRLDRGAVNRTGERYLDASGKGLNVARVLVHLGAPTLQLTPLGGRDRELFLALAAGDGVPVRAVDSGAEIRTAYTLVEAAAGVTTEVVENGPPVAPGTEAALIAAFREALPSARAVVVTGTKAAGFSDALVPGLVRDAKAAGRLVVLDVHGADLRGSLPHRPDVVKPNLAEFVATMGPPAWRAERIPEDTEDPALLAAVEDELRALHARWGSTPILTRGPRPTLYVAEGAVHRLPPPPVHPVVNPIGCGDAFAAGLTAALLRGAPLAAAIAQGHDCAARNAALLRPGRLRA
jgi:fructose-1-phosphate kinase PfkB-like protein